MCAKLNKSNENEIHCHTFSKITAAQRCQRHSVHRLVFAPFEPGSQAGVRRLVCYKVHIGLFIDRV